MAFLARLSKLSCVPIILGWRFPLLLEDSQHSTADICEKILPSVFRIMSINPQTQALHGIGSGFFIKRDGTGLTASHVLSSKNSFIAKLDSGEECPLKILHTHDLSDIALVKVQVRGPVPFLTLGDSDKNRRGEQVIHFGNALTGTTTEIDIGYISKLTEDIPPSVQMRKPEGDISAGIRYIMTNGYVRPGFSGGPLVNMKGEVVGLISRLYIKSQEPITVFEGASIPINYVKDVVKQMEISGEVKRPYLGLSFTSGNPGLIVVKVQPGSPAQKAGVRVGDFIVKANGREVNTPEDLFGEIGFQIGIALELLIVRGDEKISLKVST